MSTQLAPLSISAGEDDYDQGEDIVKLAHDLRQTLSSIEAIAYYLEMTLPFGEMDAMCHLHSVQELIGTANARLDNGLREARNRLDDPAKSPEGMEETPSIHSCRRI